MRCLAIEVASKSLWQWGQCTLLFPAGLSGSGRDKKEACPEDLRLLVELEAAVELAEVELVSRSAPETQVAIATRAELETLSSDVGMTKVKIGNMRKEVREAIPERRKE